MPVLHEVKQHYLTLKGGSMTLELWTVYKQPTDYPANFVARKFLNDQPTDEVIIRSNLKDLQQVLINKPKGLMCLQRSPDDDPCIVEVWL